MTATVLVMSKSIILEGSGNTCIYRGILAEANIVYFSSMFTSKDQYSIEPLRSYH